MNAPLDLEQFAGFTPGPWAIESDRQPNAITLRYAPGDGLASYVATIYPGALCSEHGNATANAQLIAAAPALLEECRRQRDELRWLADSEAALIRRRTEQDAEIARLRASLRECVAWMDADHRETPLQRAILDDAHAALAASEGEGA